MNPEKVKASESRIFKAVFPNTTNHYDTLGETTMQLMDEVALLQPLDIVEKSGDRE